VQLGTAETTVSIRSVRERVDFEACVLLQRAVWGLTDLEITSAPQMISTIYAGGLLHLAESQQGEAVGFAYAFPSLRATPHLYADILAVLPEYQRRGVGVRLKWAQREEALAHGVTLITSTFDPMQARTAHLVLRRLGAVATDFHENFLGVTRAALHHGLPTDRLLVRWELNAEAVKQRLQQGDPPRTTPTPALPRINDVKWQAGWPVSSEPRLDLDVPELLLEIPPEWDVLCEAGPRVAEDWQRKVRKALQLYFGRGYVASGFAPTEEGGRRRPLYVLRKP
jgi:predicted GNAT superfamily acetyltransferase